MRATFAAPLSVIQRLPSAPDVMPVPEMPANSVTVPLGVILPILPASQNQRLPSLPSAIPLIEPPVRPLEYSVMLPDGSILPTLWPLNSVNHTLPSGPAATNIGPEPEVGVLYSVI